MKHFWAVSAYFVIICLFFAYLFYPQPRLFLNPEYGRSDVSHFNIPVRSIYDQALERGEMPLWTRDMGTGFPIYAESQVGAYYVPNLVLFGGLPFWIAFNLSYLVAFFIAASGMYMLVWLLVKNRWVGFGAGLMFAFSGFFMGHTNHLNMLQTASLIPWIMYVFLRIPLKFGKAYIRWMGLFVLLLSQQMLAGHLQTSFMTGGLLVAYAGLELLEKKYRAVAVSWLAIVGAFAGAFVLSAIQILPSLELHSMSIRSQAFSIAEATHFSLSPRSFLTLFNPYALGKIQDGTYAFLKGIAEHGNIFWETNLYISLIGCGLLFYSLRYVKQKEIWSLWLLIGGSALLMLARYSPLYFVYSFPPFNIFTTPARFMLLFIFCAILVGAYVLKYLDRRLQIALVVLIFADLWVSWYGYGVTLPVQTYMKPPVTAQYILDDTSLPQAEKSVMTLESGEWNNDFLESGWTAGSKFASYFNELGPNMNVLWGIRQHREYIGRIWTQRKYIYDQNLFAVLDAEEDSVARLLAGRLLSLGSVDYLVSTHDLRLNSQLKPMFTNKPYTIYKNTEALPRFRMTDSVTKVASVEDVVDELLKDTYATSEAFIEDDFWHDDAPETTLESRIQLDKDVDRELQIYVKTNKEAVLVIADLYYPGWQATLDTKPIPYYPANIIQRAVVVPEGQHTIKMVYNPQSYMKGKLISALSYLIVLLAVFLSFSKSRLVFSATKQ